MPFLPKNHQYTWFKKLISYKTYGLHIILLERGFSSKKPELNFLNTTFMLTPDIDL